MKHSNQEIERIASLEEQLQSLQDQCCENNRAFGATRSLMISLVKEVDKHDIVGYVEDTPITAEKLIADIEAGSNFAVRFSFDVLVSFRRAILEKQRAIDHPLRENQKEADWLNWQIEMHRDQLAFQSREFDSPRQVFIQMLEQVRPDSVVWRTMSGSFTAAQIIKGLQDIDDESKVPLPEIAKQYVSDFLRVCRDIVIRSNQRD